MAEIRINDQLWTHIGPQNRENIIKILADNDLIRPEDEIIRDEHEPNASVSPEIDDWTEDFDSKIAALAAKDVCFAACVGGQAVATAACAAIGDPATTAACVVLVTQAGGLCRKRCEDL